MEGYQLKIFVFGWYGQGNLGDEVFKLSFRQLWPNATFIFGNSIPTNINTQYDALWIGGGSFLDQPISNIESVTLPIRFIGVGISSSLPPNNSKALERAELIVCRDGNSFENVPIKDKAILASDLVFARNDLKPLNLTKTKQITVILNDFLTPVGGSVPDWRSLSYYWFLQEFSKILDRFAVQDYKIKLIPMCINPRFDDRRIAGAVQGRSLYPHRYDWQLDPMTEGTLRNEISKSAFVITQRFHGLIYSLIEQRPCVALCTHDKFHSLTKDLNIPRLDYYGLTDIRFREVLDQVMKTSLDYGHYIGAAKEIWETVKII
jgi:polysaccharide pyruvyl transferase WcaK-like protein